VAEPEELTLVMLRRIDEKLDRVLEDVRDLKVRTTSLEEGVAGVQRRLDRFELRLDRIETRLDLVD
jgi:predicted  nucleic acid-binding Zn-ribbon protein